MNDTGSFVAAVLRELAQPAGPNAAGGRARRAPGDARRGAAPNRSRRVGPVRIGSSRIDSVRIDPVPVIQVR